MSPLLLEFRGIVRVVERFSIRRAHPVESRNVLTGECRFLFCFIMLYGKNWLSVICCLDCWLGLFFLSQYLANLMHKICFTLFYFMPLHVSSTCAHHQEVKIALPSLWYHTPTGGRLVHETATTWCRVLLEKLTGLQLVKKFPAFHGTRRFITTLTSVRHLSLSWASPIQSTYPHTTSWRSIIILSTHLRLDLPSVLFPSAFPSKKLYAKFHTHTKQ